MSLSFILVSFEIVIRDLDLENRGFEFDDEVESFSERNQQQTVGLITYDVC